VGRHRLRQFQLVGRDLFLAGLVSSHGGNLSVRAGERFVITRRGAMLAHLADADLVEVALDRVDERDEDASSEVAVHRAVYQTTSAGAVVHAHPPHVIARSLYADAIIPVDLESSFLVPRTPVLEADLPPGSAELGALLAGHLAAHGLAIVRGHGPFAAGVRLEDAYKLISVLDMACRILGIAEGLRRGEGRGE
jgi:L-fuculose-phosphate aldolase